MSFFNADFLPVVERAIAEIRKKGNPTFTTIELIREYWGSYLNDTTPPNDSINANIGKFLKENHCCPV